MAKKKMKKPLLSICIPTYNREEYLKCTIESVLSQADEKNINRIEICISDNGSADNTEKLVKNISKKSKIPIFYGKNSKNRGADLNFLKVIKMAHGEYCWFLSSDDELENGSINSIIKKIKENPETEIFILNNQTYDITLKKKIFGNSPLFLKFRRDYCFKDSLEAARNVNSQLGYLSILLFKRKKWLEVKGYPEFIGSAYVHVYMILSMIKNGSKVMFNSDKLIKYRFGNDSFLDALGVYKRHELDVKGFYSISAKVFGEYSKEHKAITNAFFDSHINMKLIGGIKLKRNQELTKKTYSLLFRYYKRFPKFWITVVPFMLVPTFAYEFAAKTFYKKLYQKQYNK